VRAFLNRTQHWKATVTATPGFHIRNWISNNVTGFLKHGPLWFRPRESFDAYVGAAVALDAEEAVAKRLGKERVAAALARQYGGISLREHIAFARRKGIISKATQGFDRDDTARKLLGLDKGNWNPASVEFKGFRLSHAVGSHIESSARLQSYLLDLQSMAGKGEATDAMQEWAKLEAKKWFLDYEDLSKWEQKFLKRVIPFYSWLRKNIVNQLSSLARPGMWSNLAVLPKAQTMLQEGEVDPSAMDEYMREGHFFPVGRDAEGDAVMFFPNIPIMDLNRLPIGFDPETGGPRWQGGSVLTEIMEASHPAIKTVTELWTGQDTFREMPLKEQDIAPKVFGLLKKSPKMLALFDGLMRIAGDPEGISADIDSEGRIVLDGGFVRAVENLLPQARIIEQYLDLPEELGELGEGALEDAINRFVGAEDKYEGSKELLRTLSFWFGVKLSSLDEEENRFWKAHELYSKAKEQQVSDRRLEPGAERRFEDWRGRQEDLYRRMRIY
jgi:hypothetical protein